MRGEGEGVSDDGVTICEGVRGEDVMVGDDEVTL